VINIGDAHGLAKLLDNDAALDVVPREVAQSVFARLADPDSSLSRAEHYATSLRS
jgi:hypothetical protein